MAFIITFTDGETTELNPEDQNRYFNMAKVDFLQANGAGIQIIAQLFSPVNPFGCTNLTIPVSTRDPQCWYGDTAKTIIYALLQ